MVIVVILPVFILNNILDRGLVDTEFPVSQQHQLSLMESKQHDGHDGGGAEKVQVE